MSFFAELRRRNVVRMAGLYLVGAWLLLQVAETLLPIFHTPDWVLQTLVVLLALGFVPALVFSWLFELTPEGLKRDARYRKFKRPILTVCRVGGGRASGGLGKDRVCASATSASAGRAA
jgi:hypothetical protein